MIAPWHDGVALSRATFEQLLPEVIFRGAKWDVQVGDVCTIGRGPLVLRQSLWERLVELTEALDAELLAMERELLARPDLLSELGLPRSLLRHLPGPEPALALRLRRFDFHVTETGLALSEVNADVPGGFHDGITAGLYARHLEGTRVPGDAAAALANALATRVGPEGRVALVHATAYSDDRQVMSLLANALAQVGVRGVLCAPDHLRWRGDTCHVSLGDADERVAAIIRFFPTEWLPGCPPEAQWSQFFRGPVWLCNPATCVAVQSKRLPLVWDRLRARSDTWRTLLPETRPIWDAPWWCDARWLAKPAMGRVGAGIVACGTSKPRAMASTALQAGLRPDQFIAQRRFIPLPWSMQGTSFYPCIGVFALDGRVVGAYGRASHNVFVDHRAVDTPILVADDDWGGSLAS